MARDKLNSLVTGCGFAAARRVALLVWACSSALWLAAPGARAEPDDVLRFASVAPKGSSWARSFEVFAADVERGTRGEVGVKLYLDGVAGSEREARERVAKGQLDGVLSVGLTCAATMPALRVTRVPGLFQSRDEAMYVVSELSATLEEEARRSGFVLLGVAGVGTSVIFSRRPIHDMSELRATRFWRWQGDDVAIEANRTMGLQIEPMPLAEGATAFDEGRIDGFYAAPAMALDFQWYKQVSYLVDLSGDYTVGCFMVSTRAFDRLTAAQQKGLRAAGVRLSLRFEELGRKQEEALLGSIFPKHGIEIVPVSAQLRAEYFQAARQARDEVSEGLVPESLLNRVMRLLADYSAEHGRAQ